MAGLRGRDRRVGRYLEAPGLEREQSFVQDGVSALGLEGCVGVHQTDEQELYKATGTAYKQIWWLRITEASSPLSLCGPHRGHLW